jgi:hypothetical protein
MIMTTDQKIQLLNSLIALLSVPNFDPEQSRGSITLIELLIKDLGQDYLK